MTVATPETLRRNFLPEKRRKGAAGGGVVGVRIPVCYQRPGLLTLMRVEAVSTARDTALALWVVERLFIGYRDAYSGFGEPWSVRKLQ